MLFSDFAEAFVEVLGGVGFFNAIIWSEFY